MKFSLAIIENMFKQSIDERTHINLKNLHFSEFVSIAKSANEMINGLNIQAEELRYHALHDHLTELPNRKKAFLQLNEKIAYSLQKNSNGALFFLDLDNFKEVNDTLGHSTGDELLKQVSHRLKNVIGPGDTIARLGGDEFTVISNDIKNREYIISIAQKLAEAFISPFFIEGMTLRVTASIGISLFPDDGRDAESLLKHADSAMYQSKRQGKNRFSFYSPLLTQEMEQRLKFVDEIHQAIHEQQFLLYYQPQINIQDGSLLGVEALIRWQHPTKGLMSPCEFIPYAEYSGQITEIGSWVLTQACQQMAEWKRKNINIHSVSVNISNRQLQTDNLTKLVKTTLDKTGCLGHWLELEITESIIIENLQELSNQLTELQEIGVSVSIDDFGTGYSSLSYIKQLPIDTLKIDQSFIRDINDDENDREITKAIISMGNSLNLNVIAEGVENTEQIQFLKREGCLEAQGYFYSQPITCTDIEAYIQTLPSTVINVDECIDD